MREDFDRKIRSKRKKSGSSKGLIVGLSIGGGLLLLTFVGLVLYFTLGKSGKSGDSSGGGGLFDLTNARVTEENYYAVKDGFRLADVEALLGEGRSPTSGDFDAIFGAKDERVNLARGGTLYQMRPTWEEKHRRGLVLAWSSGSTRLLIVFTQLPDRGGRVISMAFQGADGSVSIRSGTGQLASEPGPSSKPAPAPKTNPNTPNQSAAAAWEQLVGTWEVDGDPRLRLRFGADKKIGDIFMVDGRQVREKVYSVRDVKIENGRIAPQIDLGSFNGKAMNGPALGVFWLENGTLHRDPGNGKPAQTLRRVN